MDPFADFDLFEQEEAASRAAARADRIRAGEEYAAAESTAAAIQCARTLQGIADWTQESILREYAAAGLEPPPGQLVSLSLLRKFGWRVENVGGERVLVKPRGEA